MKNKTSQSGFTLIELIAVMVILGILAAVIIPRITTITSGAYESNVRNMYGLIKNEITAQAVKAAMSGKFLETYPDPAAACSGCPPAGDMDAEDYFLETWVGDFDVDQWSSFTKLNFYDNGASGVDPYHLTNMVLFMYHPHGKPSGDLTWAGGSFDDTFPGGNSANKEDIYWILYAPRTSSGGKLKGRELDGYVMGAWVSSENDFTFDGVIAQDGSLSGTNDDPIEDLAIVYSGAE